MLYTLRTSAKDGLEGPETAHWAASVTGRSGAVSPTTELGRPLRHVRAQTHNWAQIVERYEVAGIPCAARVEKRFLRRFSGAVLGAMQYPGALRILIDADGIHLEVAIHRARYKAVFLTASRYHTPHPVPVMMPNNPSPIYFQR